MARGYAQLKLKVAHSCARLKWKVAHGCAQLKWKVAHGCNHMCGSYALSCATIKHVGQGENLSIYLFFCSNLRVPRKRSVRWTGSVWQRRYNVYYPACRNCMPSEDDGMYT